MQRLSSKYGQNFSFYSYRENEVFPSKHDFLVKAGTLFLIFAMGCCIYFYGSSLRSQQSYHERSSLVKPLTDEFLHSPEIQ